MILEKNDELQKQLTEALALLTKKNHELEIETSLERVRTQVMLMKKPSELLTICQTLFEELKTLGFDDLRNTMINIMYDDEGSFLNYDFSGYGGATINNYFHESDASVKIFIQRIKESEDVFVENIVAGEALEHWKKFRLENGEAPDPRMDEVDAIYYYFYSIAKGAVGVGNYTAVTPEKLEILKRFRNVFALAYRRYIDIEHLAEQARLAQIETSLEHVRFKAMAMQKSSDLATAVATVFEELDKLNLGTFRVGLGILNKEKRNAEVWTTAKSEEGSVIQVSGDEPMDIHPLLLNAFNAWVKQEQDYSHTLEGEDLVRFYEALTKTNFKLPESHTSVSSLKQYYYVATLKAGGLYAFRETPFTEEAKLLLRRFAQVLDLTYTRFLDLQNAEMQTREAKIELALEKVRARAMAMKNSDELSELVSILFLELVKLDIILARCIIWILDPVSLSSRIWMANSEEKNAAESYLIKKIDHPYYDAILKGWKERTSKWTYELKGTEKKSIDTLLLKETELSHLSDAVKKGIESSSQTFVSGSFNNFGLIEASGPVAHTDEQLEILSRFGKVFDLSYTRFLDLKQVEIQAKEALRQASLDRLRAEIASMRTTNDLEKITPLIWAELKALDVPFIRCGVFIMDNLNETIQSFLSTPDGKAIASYHMPYSDAGVVEPVLRHWQQKKKYVVHWDEKNFSDLADTLMRQHGIISRDEYVSAIPQAGVHLHFLPFMQGMLYVGNTSLLNKASINIVQSIADTFSAAYSRYEDFSKLEAAKLQVEKTLSDLKQAQAQLIQSEKMASLGELTVGIAHEIQNPLNFVNNFSEVSSELIEEMKNGLEKNDHDEVNIIARDIQQNLEKILFHGRRADAIVKGMLQHSRTSTGLNEPTDINALADEYLRLSYHGLRAKDKSFNATMETNFDTTIGKINIIPQDIGRALLNIYNNAFYAVSKKKNLNSGNYEPKIIVATRKMSDKVEISIHDNGIGIPNKILDKIFQPFFTTKPTGQGTGLGLSLAYDIIKTHKGELLVKTLEGEGTEFIIVLKAI